MAKARKPAKKPAATRPEKNPAKKQAAKAIAKPAEKKSENGESRARILLELISGNRDEVAAYEAALEAVALANEGTLEPATAFEVWEAASLWIQYPGSMRAWKACEKRAAASGYPSLHAVILDCTKRWLDAANGRALERVSEIARARVRALGLTGAGDEALSTFDTFMPVVQRQLAEKQIGTMGYGAWFDQILELLRKAGRQQDVDRIEQLRNAEASRLGTHL